MHEGENMGHNPGKRLLDYGVAVLVVAAALFVCWLIGPRVGDPLPLAILFGAGAVVVWIGGYRPALLAAVLGFLGCKILFLQPHGEAVFLSPRDLIELLVYSLTCAILIGFGESLRRARLNIEREREKV